MDESFGKVPKGGGGGGGNFQSKPLCRFWTIKQGFKKDLFEREKKLHHDFAKMRGGGGQRPFGTFLKVHPF